MTKGETGGRYYGKMYDPTKDNGRYSAKECFYEPRTPTLEEVAWLAGLWEGEGCWYINPERKWWSNQRQKYYTSSAYIRMSLGMTDRDVVERVAAIMDGRKVRHEYRSKKNPNHKDMYWMQLQGAAAYRWTMHMKPYLGERRKHKIDWIMKEAYNKDIGIIESLTMEVEENVIINPLTNLLYGV